MPLVITERQDDLAILRLNSGVINPINSDLVDELANSLVDIRENARGMALCGGSKFFSVGLDLPVLLKLDRAEMNIFWEKFNRLCLELLTMPIPTFCVLAGHAVAGGCILALACDYRYAISEKRQIGLNEIKLGVPVPYLADLILRDIVGQRYASQMMFSGEFMTFSDAKVIGLVDAICEPDELEAFSIERLSTLAKYENKAFAAIKANKVEGIKAKYGDKHRSKNEAFLDCWFSDPVQRILVDASKKF